MLFSLPIPAGYEAIERPIVFQLTRQLMKERLLPNVERIIFKDQVDQVALKNAKGGDCPTGVHYEKDAFIEVTVQKTTRDLPNGLQVNYSEYPTIMRDEEHELSMTTVYVPTTIELEFNVVTPSIAALRNYRSTVRQILTAGRELALHDFEYKYTLPHNSWTWLNDMHSLMDTELSLVDWVSARSVNNLQLVTAGTHLEAAIADRQLGVVGHVSSRPTGIEKNNSAGVYRISLGYELRFNQPDNVMYRYPLMVNQTVIDQKYIPEPKGYDPYFFWDSSVDGLKVEMMERRRPVRIPEIDTEVISKYPNGYRPLLTVMVSIEDTDELECFNLLELGDVQIDRRLLKALVTTIGTDKLTSPYFSPFILTLHKHSKLMDKEYIEVDNNLNVHFSEPMDKKGIYRVSLCVLDLPYRLPDSIRNSIYGSPDLFYLYIRLLQWCNIYTGQLTDYQIQGIIDFCGGLTPEQALETLTPVDGTDDDGNTIPGSSIPLRPPYIYLSGAYKRLNKTVQTTWVNIK